MHTALHEKVWTTSFATLIANPMFVWDRVTGTASNPTDLNNPNTPHNPKNPKKPNYPNNSNNRLILKCRTILEKPITSTSTTNLYNPTTVVRRDRKHRVAGVGDGHGPTRDSAGE